MRPRSLSRSVNVTFVIFLAQPEIHCGAEATRQGRTDELGQFPGGSVRGDRLHQNLARHGTGDERLQRRPLECSGNGVDEKADGDGYQRQSPRP